MAKESGNLVTKCETAHSGRACPLSGVCAPKRRKGDAKLRDLRAKVIDMHIKMAPRWKFTAWRCPNCRCLNAHNVPKRSDTGSKGYWDSAIVCIWCGAMSFLAVWPDGRCRAKMLGGERTIVETSTKPQPFGKLTASIDGDYVL